MPTHHHHAHLHHNHLRSDVSLDTTLHIRDTLLPRDDSNSTALTPTMIKLMIALIVLVVVGICAVAGLFVLRSRRKAKDQQKSHLPFHKSNHRRLTITASPYGRRSESIYVYKEKDTLISEAGSPPPSPIPEIRITFPEEEDEAGKRKSGRVVVVRISETGGVGLEPYNDDHLPPYQRVESERFESLDLDRMGGLKEIERGPRPS